MLDNAVPQYAYPQAFGTDPISTQMLRNLSYARAVKHHQAVCLLFLKLVLHSHKALSHISKGWRRS